MGPCLFYFPYQIQACQRILRKKQIINRVLNKAYAMGLSKEDIIVDGLVNTVGANQICHRCY